MTVLSCVLKAGELNTRARGESGFQHAIAIPASNTKIIFFI
jgi:hypothetical protein